MFPIDIAHTLNEQLKDHEEQFTEFDKKIYWIRITDCTFKQEVRCDGERQWRFKQKLRSLSDTNKRKRGDRVGNLSL